MVKHNMPIKNNTNMTYDIFFIIAPNKLVLNAFIITYAKKLKQDLKKAEIAGLFRLF
jgi:hypothetical protein